jgi:Arabinose efflux permease
MSDTSGVSRRNLSFWMAGSTLSLFGGAAVWLAFGLWVKDLTGSNAMAGLVFMAYLCPRLLAPLTGLMVDRLSRRRLIIVLNVILAAVTLLALPVREAGHIWVLYTVLFVVGLGGGIQHAAGGALLVQLVPEEQLGRTNALLRTLQEIGMLVAPAVGTALYATAGPRWVLAAEAVTFLACAGCVAIVRVEETRAETAGRLRTEMAAGAVHLWRTPLLRRIALAMGASLLVFGFFETIIYTLVDHGLNLGTPFVGVLTVVKAAGSVLGGLLAMWMAGKLRNGRDSLLTVTGLSLMATGCTLLILPGVPVAVCGVFLIGMGIPPAVVGLFTSVQRDSPVTIQGRVGSAASMVVTTPQVVSVAIGAALAGAVDYRLLLAVMVLVIAGSALSLARGGRAGPITDRPEPAAVSAGDDGDGATISNVSAK